MSLLIPVSMAILLFFAIIGVFGLAGAIGGLVVAVTFSLAVFRARREREQAQ